MDPKDATNRFNCPIDECVYGVNGDKYFKRKLFLTQHIANKHSEKKFSCDKCHKKYAIEWQLRYHQKSCGIQWRCGSCGKSYSERLSLVMHCKRHSHYLPQNTSIKTSKSSVMSPPINVQLVVLPVIVDPINTSFQTVNQKLINILPKTSDSGTQTVVTETCNKCKSKSNSNIYSDKRVKKFNSISIQTDRLTNRKNKSGEQRSTDCQTIRKRNRKPHSNNYESIETQTLESTFHSNKFSTQKNCIKISASTSTSPPKKSKKKCSTICGPNAKLPATDVQKSCVFTQTIGQTELSTATGTTSEPPDLLVNQLNPLLSQMDGSNSILEQSVQTDVETDANDIFATNEFNNIETQTANLDFDANGLLDFGDDQEFLFSDLEFTDIETQTIWNNDRTTQTDEHLDQINDAFLRYFETDDNGCDINISDRTVFADTQTQTTVDLPSLIGSSTQTSQTFN